MNKTKTKTLEKAEIATLMGCKETSAIARLVALGYTEVCTRCGGCGRYSWNQINGDVCFGCGGSGKKLARITAATVTEALARIAAGELEGYFAENKARRELKAAKDKLWATYMAGRVGKDYSTWSDAMSKSAMVRAKAGEEPYPENWLDTPVYRAQSLRNQIMDRATEAFFDRKSTHLSRIAVIRAAEAAVLEVERAWATFTEVCK